MLQQIRFKKLKIASKAVLTHFNVNRVRNLIRVISKVLPSANKKGSIVLGGDHLGGVNWHARNFADTWHTPDHSYQQGGDIFAPHNRYKGRLRLNVWRDLLNERVMMAKSVQERAKRRERRRRRATSHTRGWIWAPRSHSLHFQAADKLHRATTLARANMWFILQEKSAGTHAPYMCA